MFLFKHQHPVITILNYSCDYLSNYNLQRDQTPEMADDLDIDDLLEAPYKKPEDAEVNIMNEGVCFLRLQRQT